MIVPKDLLLRGQSISIPINGGGGSVEQTRALNI